MLKLRFDDNNPNSLILYGDSMDGKRKRWYPIAISPGTDRTDIINFKNGSPGYEYNSNAIIIISNGKDRYVYHKGRLCAHTRLK